MANYNEALLGDLSDDISNPTAHEFFPGKLVLFAGSNVVTGSTTKRTTSANGGDEDRDFFVFDVPSGFTVDAIILRSYQQTGGGNSYFALTEGNVFPADSIVNDEFPKRALDFTVSKLIDNDEVGGEQDLLAPKESADYPELGPKANPGQLDAGTYTAWYQETANPTTYSFDIRLKAPEGANFGQIQFDPSSFSVDEDAGTFDITLKRTGGTDGNIGVVLRHLRRGTATNLNDFNFHPVTAIFEQGEAEKTFTYSLLDDDLVEGDETALFELVDPMGGVAIGSNNRATLTILDNDSPGSTGDDTLYGGEDDDTFESGDGNNLFYAGEGNNSVTARDGNNIVYAGAGNDTVALGDGNNDIRVGEGENKITAGNGDNLIYGGSNVDTILVGGGNNQIYAGEGKNVITTGNGDNLIYGGAASDRIKTGAGNDTIYAAEGNNHIDAGTGNNIVNSGSGSDLFILTSGEGATTITQFNLGKDLLGLTGGLSFTQLSITQGRNGNEFFTQIGIAGSNDLLATLKWVNASAITNASFTSV